MITKMACQSLSWFRIYHEIHPLYLIFPPILPTPGYLPPLAPSGNLEAAHGLGDPFREKLGRAAALPGKPGSELVASRLL